MVHNTNRLPGCKQLLTGFPVERQQFVFQVARLLDPPPELPGSHLRRRFRKVTKRQLIKRPHPGVISRFFHTFQLFVYSYNVRKKGEKNKDIRVNLQGVCEIFATHNTYKIPQNNLECRTWEPLRQHTSARWGRVVVSLFHNHFRTLTLKFLMLCQ